ncbi:hypothetical protein JYU03_00210 [bacterium AH-315-F03]|nr:hypothetical protein [bacterium AH-315-F03]MBN4076514.1 hypothetical protein [Gemmatimonas aurantiaca]
MNNDKARKILSEVVDGEASQMECDEFNAHLAENAMMKSRYEFEKRFRSFISAPKSDANSGSDIESLPSSVRRAIVDKLDAIDAEVLAAESPEFENTRTSPLNITQSSRRIAPRYAMAMVASFALMVTGIWLTIEFFQHQTAFGSFENAHFVAREMGDTFGQFETTVDATSFITQKFGVNLADDIEGLSLCGGEVVILDNSEFAHFKFCDSNDEPVSIFVGSAADYALPEMPLTISAGKEYFRHICHGCELMYWRSGDALIVAASKPDHLDSRPISALILNVLEDNDIEDSQ